MTSSTQDKTSKSSRRDSLKLLALGATASVPAWKAPVIQSMVLPAHAQTTMAEGQFSGSLDDVLFDAGIFKIEPDIDQNDLISSVESGPLDWIVPEAEANGSSATHICINISSGVFTCDFQNKCEYFTLTGNVGDPLTSMQSDCGIFEYALAVNNVGEDGARIQMSINSKKQIEFIASVVPLQTCTFEYDCFCDES